MPRSAERILHAARGQDHPTADDVVVAMPRAGEPLGRATVYRNLSRFDQAGRLRVRDIGDQKRDEPHTEAHVHDTTAGRILDPPMTPHLRDAQSAVAADLLETPDDCIVEIRGRRKET